MIEALRPLLKRLLELPSSSTLYRDGRDVWISDRSSEWYVRRDGTKYRVYLRGPQSSSYEYFLKVDDNEEPGCGQPYSIKLLREFLSFLERSYALDALAGI
ncbi:MAG: hypothetical protein AB7L09_01700 [Nitrospira sp.]